ncbi:NAD-glutamate dehydrogenase [Thalassotalea psychrophila]|uniref:NAD-glutamate dehydrogenase n=1 Tax=Thalassotalea psychrophila TaxID=3065647 RepID=A0ABY9TNY2_9GAMM|nr:NAD-glutamate dehydrogenase [Colwelliaceae bacterium SQ149]
MTTAITQNLNSYIANNYSEANVQPFTEFSQVLLESSLNDEVQLMPLERRFDLALSLWESFTTRQRQENKVVIKTLRQDGANVSTLHIISDDKPFIFDSITNLLLAEGYRIKNCLHPVINNEQETIDTDIQQESDVSVIYIELSSLLNDKACTSLKEKLLTLLIEVKMVTDDWPVMLKQAKAVADVQSNHANNGDNSEQVQDFLHWLCQDNFTFLGYYPFIIDERNKQKNHIESLGIFKQSIDPLTLDKSVLRINSKELQHFIDSEQALLISKSTVKAKIHRNDYYDQISIKEYSAQGDVIAIHRFIGLFTQAVNSQNPIKIPYLQAKLNAVLDRVNYKEESHNYKKFRHILKALPKREIFESNAANLFSLAKGIYNLNAQSKCGTFIRENNFNQQVSALVFVSKDAFCTDLRDEIEAQLCEFYGGKILSRCSMLNDNYLAQWHFTLVKGEQASSNVNLTDLINRIEEKTKSWMESLCTLIQERWDDAQATQLINKYSNCFSKSYREKFSALAAAKDIEYFETLNQDQKYQFQIYRNEQDQHNLLRLNIYSQAQGIALSDSIPILENLGFRPLDEFSFKVLADNNSSNDLYSYTLECPSDKTLDLKQVKANLEQALTDIWAQEIENDGYNKLLLTANINIRQIVIIRAYGKYLRQLGLGYSEEYFQQALIAYPEIVGDLVALFEQRFSLNNSSISKRMLLANDIAKCLFGRLNKVSKIDHDRILRNFIAAISATVRTNFYQLSNTGQQKSYCSFKILSGEIEDAPQPRPYVETFVYSPRVEGVHLRFSAVSRGGLRWSDREEDFRTEILGLVKAQQVKNVVIVPQGAKGGFVPKQLPSDGSRDEITSEAIECYKLFISSLLDITDNNTQQGIIKPQQVVCFDGDDSYLVVAADKGTATFSDIANELANDYDFWLGDAFASGGSVGYDHKKMGITAKGAWVSVQRHFREMDVDVQHDEITAIGIGDMSGDVFGNGMLSSNTIKLVAAFDHRDIFIDPAPVASTSFKERQRLYNLPRSSWVDYSAELISAGGGVFSRSLKRITPSEQIKKLLKIPGHVETLSPNQLISYILKANADLLWFGGIGTYVKATEENNNDVGDKGNDPLRVNAAQLQCKVIGEGGNLGCTQLARIEFAKAGGRVNTDAVDNSAGVNCSDNEVNIKILLNRLLSDGNLIKGERDSLLEQMTTDVSKMVLQNNTYQVQALSLDEANNHAHFDSFTRLTHYLVDSVDLNRELEYLPDDDELQTRILNKKGLTRPELAVLMAYSKMDVNNALLKQTSLLDDEYFEKYLLAAFPPVLQEKYQQEIVEHPLAKQIIATAVANEIFNRGGIHAVREQTGASIEQIVKAFIITKEIFQLDSIWKEIESLDGIVSAEIQVKMLVEVQRFYRLMAIWFINHDDHQSSINSVVAKFSPGINLLQQLNSDEVILPFTPVSKSLYQLQAGENSRSIVDKIHQLKVSSVVFCDIVKTAAELKVSVEQVLVSYQKITQIIGISWLIEQTEIVETTDHWSRMALFSLLLDLLELREQLVLKISTRYNKFACDVAIDKWADTKVADLSRVERVIDDLKVAGVLTIDKLYFANRQMRTLLS